MPLQYNLFDTMNNGETWKEQVCEGVVVLRQFAVDKAPLILQTANKIIQQAPFRRMTTPGGFTMSAELTSCGKYGWISDQNGYRYSSIDPQSNLAWPKLPELFYDFAQYAAEQAGFTDFKPDVCMINRYAPGSKMSLHQDKNERDFSINAPIVSLSLGVPATFYFGGLNRSDTTIKIPLIHGDVVVWGGISRLCFHGVAPIKKDYHPHPMLGEHRFNLTFRKVD